jgi:hypothetical protein
MTRPAGLSLATENFLLANRENDREHSFVTLDKIHYSVQSLRKAIKLTIVFQAIKKAVGLEH